MSNKPPDIRFDYRPPPRTLDPGLTLSNITSESPSMPSAAMEEGSSRSKARLLFSRSEGMLTISVSKKTEEGRYKSRRHVRMRRRDQWDDELEQLANGKEGWDEYEVEALRAFLESRLVLESSINV